MIERIRQFLIPALGIALALFTVYEVNFGILPPLSQLAVFAMLGMVLCFLMFPVHPRLKENTPLRIVDLLLSLGTIICCVYLIGQGTDLSARAGKFTQLDYQMAIAGTLLVLEATRRSIGWALPILSGAFLLYAYFGASLPEWAFFHRGYDVERIAAKCFLGSEGIFGTAMRVMFTYVFLFVVFGAFLEVSGATQFIIDFAEKVFGNSPGGPAKVSVLASGLMGSLSGSAVANAVTTGAFTIPMMRSSGFKPHVAGGITAAAASGGALVPPVMGAGAYMMLELIDDVTFLEIASAAVVPALLYYVSILMIVHFYSRRVGTQAVAQSDEPKRSLWQYEGLVFFGALGTLILFLLLGFTPFRAVTYSLEVILLLTIISPRIEISRGDRTISLLAFGGATLLVALIRTRVDGWNAGGNNAALELLSKIFSASENLSLLDWQVWADSAIAGLVLLLVLGLLHRVWRPIILEAFTKSARAGISLVAASACVGIIIGVVTLTGVGTAFPNAVVPIAQESLFLAMVAIMVCSIVLGMGLPSAVCYLLMATLIGPVLGQLGVVPLAAHLFIFYFGMMSMVTPPVALAAYASASIADANIMQTGLAAFRFALVGFTLPFMFVYRPELLLLTEKPEVTVSLAKPKEVKTGEPAEIVADLDWYGTPPDFVKLDFSPVGKADASVTARTRPGGSTRLELSSGEWSVTSYKRSKKVISLDDAKEYHLKDGERILTRDGRPLLSDGEPPLTGAELRNRADGGKVLLTRDGSPQFLGTLSLNTAGRAPGEESEAADNRLRFTEGRLSIVSVSIAIGAALVGILALAAGVAGYMFSELRVWVRVAMLVAAALLLSPDLEIGGTEIGTYTNIAGAAMLVVLAMLNKQKTNAESRAAAEPAS